MSEYAYVLQNFEAEAGAIVERAREKARQIFLHALQEASALEAKAREEGERKGMEEGCAQGRQQESERIASTASTVVQALSETLRGIEEQRREWVATGEKELVSLSLAIAEKIVRASIEIDAEVITRTLQKAVEMAAQRQQFEIRIHPQDMAAVENFLPTLKERFLDVQSIRLVTDEAVSRGGARVRTVTGEVDAQIETQLGQLRGALLGQGETPA